MEIDRTLIKSQARQLIKDRVINLFVITIVMTLIVNLFSTYSYVKTFVDGYNDGYNNGSGNYHQYSDDYFGNSKGNSNNGDNPIDSFGTNSYDENYFDGITGRVMPSINTVNAYPSNSTLFSNSSLSTTATIISIFLFSFEIGIATLYLRISRNEYEGFSNEFKNSFKVSFSNGYGKKVGVILVKRILINLYALLLIIPGIIEGYRLYFVELIMAENPNLTIGQVNEVSKKMTSGHKTELLKLDLSFIGWYLLTILTFGIANIYVMPYVYTTRALYYQNFKIRCMQEGKLSPLDFMSYDERRQNYNYFNNGNCSQANYYNDNNNYGTQGQQGYYNSNMGFNSTQPSYQNPNMNYNGNMPNQYYQHSNMNVNNQQFNQSVNPNYAQNGYSRAFGVNYSVTSPNTQITPNQPNNEQYGDSKANAVNNVGNDNAQNVSVDDVVNSDNKTSEVARDLNQNSSASQTQEVCKESDELN